MEKRIIVFGEVLVDKVNDQWHPGGAPFNVASHLRALGQDPLFISAIGKDEIGNFLLKKASEWGIDLNGIQKNSYPSGLVDIHIKNNEPNYEILNNRAYDYIDNNLNIDITNTDILYYGSLALRNNTTRNTLDSIIKNFEGTKFVDINIRHPWFSLENFRPYMTDIDWLKINHLELFEIIDGTEDIEHAIKQLSKQYNITNIICTRGKEDVILYSQSTDNFYYKKTIENRNIKTTVGAGDSFAAAVIDSIKKGEDYKVLLSRAVKISSEVCGINGAIPEDKSFYNRINYGY